MTKRIKFARVSMLSLCKRGANRLPGLYKSDGDQVVFEALAKLDDEGMLTSLVYAPETEDSQAHLASSEAIEEMAHSFMASGAPLDVNHDLKPLEKERAFVAESFIVQPGDPRFVDATDSQGNPIDATGAWCVKTKLNDPELRKLYREEGWNGVSLYAKPGDYELEDVPITKAERVAEAVAARKQGKSVMDEEKLAAALAKALAPIVEKIDGLTKVQSTPPTEPPAPESKDPVELELPDPTDAKAMAKYKAELKKRIEIEKRRELADKFDLTTLDGLEKYEAALAKLDGSEEPEVQDNQDDYRQGAADPLALIKNSVYSDESGLTKAQLDAINASLEERGTLNPKYAKAGA